MSPTPDAFELIEPPLGPGGMGVVWRARNRSTGELVALKRLHGHLAEEPEYVQRFEREIEIARRIDSPHTVRVLGYGVADGIPFAAMELVEGESLRELLLRDGPLPWERARPIIDQIAAGLRAAHAQNVVHRDIKPSNVLIQADGAVKVADFGISRALDMTRLTGAARCWGRRRMRRRTASRRRLVTTTRSVASPTSCSLARLPSKARASRSCGCGTTTKSQTFRVCPEMLGRSSVHC